MKFDYDTAWGEAVDLFKSNFSLLAAVAGVFVFLPSAAAVLIAPEASLESQLGGNADPDMEAIRNAVMTLTNDYWWLIGGLFLLSAFAQLAMLVLMRRGQNPTVGDALGESVALLATYVGAQLLQLGLFLLLSLALVGLPALLGLQWLAVIGGLIAVPVFVYLAIKFSMCSPIIAIDGERNPVEALRRSWISTKGNSLRLFGYFLLIGVAMIIIIAVTSWIVGIVLAFAGNETVRIGEALFGAALEALIAIAGAAIIAAVYAQLVRLARNRRKGERAQ